MDIEELKAEMEALGIRTLTAEEEAELDLPDLTGLTWHHGIIVTPKGRRVFAEVWTQGDDLFGWTPLTPDDFDERQDFIDYYRQALRRPVTYSESED